MSRHSQQLAHRIHVLRAARDWTPERLAEEVSQHGVLWSNAVVANVEGGRRDNLTVDELFAVAAAFGIAPMTFFAHDAFHSAVTATLAGQAPVATEADVPGAE